MTTSTNYKERNEEVYKEIEGIFEKLVWGKVTIDFDIHNKRVTNITVHGKETRKYNKQQSTTTQRRY